MLNLLERNEKLNILVDIKFRLSYACYHDMKDAVTAFYFSILTHNKACFSTLTVSQEQYYSKSLPTIQLD